MMNAQEAGGKYGIRIGKYTGLPVAIYNALEVARVYFTHEPADAALIERRIGFVIYGLLWFGACYLAGRAAGKTLAKSEGGMPLGIAIWRGLVFMLTALAITTIGTTIVLTLFTVSTNGFGNVVTQSLFAFGLALGAVFIVAIPVLIGGVVLGVLAHRRRRLPSGSRSAV